MVNIKSGHDAKCVHGRREKDALGAHVGELRMSCWVRPRNSFARFVNSPHELHFSEFILRK